MHLQTNIATSTSQLPTFGPHTCASIPPPQRVADPLETHRLHTPRAGSGVNRRNRRARIDQAPPEEGHSNCCALLESQTVSYSGATRGLLGGDSGATRAPVANERRVVYRATKARPKLHKMTFASAPEWTDCVY